MAVVVVEHRLELLHAVAETVVGHGRRQDRSRRVRRRRLRRSCRPCCVLRGAQGRMTAVLEVRRLSAGYGPLRVLHDIDLAVDPGERVGLVGLNGHGKTTLLRSIMGLVDWRRGRDRARREVDHADAGAQAGTGGGRADPQGDALFPGLSVKDNLDSGAFAGRLAGAEAAAGAGAAALPSPGGPPRPGRRHALRRRAADVLARARPDVGRSRLPDRRALARPCPGDRGRALRDAEGARCSGAARSSSPSRTRRCWKGGSTGSCGFTVARSSASSRAACPPNGEPAGAGDRRQARDRSRHHHQPRRHLRADRPSASRSPGPVSASSTSPTASPSPPLSTAPGGRRRTSRITPPSSSSAASSSERSQGRSSA